MPNAIRTMLVAAMLAISSGMANAGPHEDADTAYVRKDYATALKLFLPLAEQGDRWAQFRLGNMYFAGDGVPANYLEGLKWLSKAADQGDDFAQFMLGYRYENGESVPQNDAEAVKWYRKAAEQGDRASQFRLGNMYANGKGVPESTVQAYKWYNLAAAQGNAAAKSAKADIEKRMKREQIAEAQKLSAEWKPSTQP